MGKLWEQLGQDLVTAMKAKDALTLSVLRMAKAAMTHLAIEKKKDVLDDAEIIDVLSKQLKQRKESYEAFTQGGRTELAQKEQSEMAILEKYLPKQLDTSELEILIKQAIKDSGAQSKADMGKLMGVLMPKIKGRADGKIVNQMIQSFLV